MFFSVASVLSFRSRPYHVVAALFFLVLGAVYYGPLLDELPNGIHTWAQTDRLSLALNFYDYGFDFFTPRTSSLESIGGITGVEFPLQAYLAALGGLIFGRGSIVTLFRLLDVAVTLLGFYYLFRLVFERTGHFVAGLVPGVFLLASPFFAFYAGGFLPDPFSLALSFVGYYYWARFFDNRHFPDLRVAVLVLGLAGLIKTTTALHLGAVAVITLVWSFLQPDRLTLRQRLEFLALMLGVVGIIGTFFVHNQHLNTTYQSGQFLAEVRPIPDPETFHDVFMNVRRSWLAEYATIPQYRILGVCIVLLLVFVRRNLRRNLPLTLLLLAATLIGLVFAQLMGAQFGVHDYYLICAALPEFRPKQLRSRTAKVSAVEKSGESLETFDVIVVGGGPSGATAATELARAGKRVMLLDRAGRIKPCGGAIPPRLVRDFDIPNDLIVARATGARMIAPSETRVDMPIENGFVGMVDREHYDEWLRNRASLAGAVRRTGTFERIERDDGAGPIVCFSEGSDQKSRVRARCVIGADGALSAVGRQEVPGADKMPFVFAYHEIVESPPSENAEGGLFDPSRCDVFYQGKLSPDFYAWIFPHGATTSIGTGSARKGFGLRKAVGDLRATVGLAGQRTIRREGAPIPMKPLKRWDNGRDVLLAGDAAGVVAPASGEGIYYAMLGGQLAATAAADFLRTGDVKALASARKTFMRAHGRVFFVLGIMQYFWYSSEKRRERFVSICRDADVQRLTWQAYMNKELVRTDPLAHAKIFFKDLGHLLGLVRA